MDGKQLFWLLQTEIEIANLLADTGEYIRDVAHEGVMADGIDKQAYLVLENLARFAESVGISPGAIRYRGATDLEQMDFLLLGRKVADAVAVNIDPKEVCIEPVISIYASYACRVAVIGDDEKQGEKVFEKYFPNQREQSESNMEGGDRTEGG